MKKLIIKIITKVAVALDLSIMINMQIHNDETTKSFNYQVKPIYSEQGSFVITHSEFFS